MKPPEYVGLLGICLSLITIPPGHTQDSPLLQPVLPDVPFDQLQQWLDNYNLQNPFEQMHIVDFGAKPFSEADAPAIMPPLESLALNFSYPTSYSIDTSTFTLGPAFTLGFQPVEQTVFGVQTVPEPSAISISFVLGLLVLLFSTRQKGILKRGSKNLANVTSAS